MLNNMAITSTHEEEVIGVVKKNDTNEVRVSTVKHKSGNRIDLRWYFYSEEKDKYIPTRKGVTVLEDEIEEFSKYFNKAVEKLRE